MAAVCARFDVCGMHGCKRKCKLNLLLCDARVSKVEQADAFVL